MPGGHEVMHISEIHSGSGMVRPEEPNVEEIGQFSKLLTKKELRIF